MDTLFTLVAWGGLAGKCVQMVSLNLVAYKKGGALLFIFIFLWGCRKQNSVKIYCIEAGEEGNSIHYCIIIGLKIQRMKETSHFQLQSLLHTLPSAKLFLQIHILR